MLIKRFSSITSPKAEENAKIEIIKVFELFQVDYFLDSPPIVNMVMYRAFWQPVSLSQNI